MGLIIAPFGHTGAVDGGAGRPGSTDGGLQRLVSDVERDATVSTLGDAASQGVLTPAEFDERMTAALAARRLGELQSLTADLPRGNLAPGGTPAAPAPRPRQWWHQAGFEYDASAYVLVNGLLVGTWALTGHHFFWPFFPIAGWGIGLGAHGVTAQRLWRRRQRRAQRALVASPYAGTGAGRGTGTGTGTGSSTGSGSGSSSGSGGVGARSPRVGAVPAAPVPGPGRQATPRYVAVLFADMAGSTALNERLGDAAFNQVRVACLQGMRRAVAAEGGTEVSSQGDGLFARFDDPGAAVRASVAVQRWAASSSTPDAGGGPPLLHVGVHAGPAIEDGADLIGNMVNLAARVSAVAAGGEVLVTESVADLGGDGFSFDDRGMHELKGIARPRHLLAVRWR